MWIHLGAKLFAYARIGMMIYLCSERIQKWLQVFKYLSPKLTVSQQTDFSTRAYNAPIISCIKNRLLNPEALQEGGGEEVLRFPPMVGRGIWHSLYATLMEFPRYPRT